MDIFHLYRTHKMKPKYLTLLVSLLLLVFTSGCNSTTKEKQSGAVMGIPWKLTDYLILPNATWNKSDANKLVFKEAFIDKNSIRFNGQTCKGVNFKHSTVSLNQHLSTKYHISVGAMNLPEQQVSKISTNCNISGFNNYLRLNDRRILIFINGVAFFLTPGIN